MERESYNETIKSKIYSRVKDRVLSERELSVRE